MNNFFDKFLKQEKTFFTFAVLINLFLISLIVYYGFAAWRLAEPANPAVAQVSFSGEGKVLAKPDIAKISFAIISDGETLLKVQEENTFRSNRVVEFLKKAGVDNKDIKTSSYNIQPQYSSSRPCFSNVCPEPEKRPKILGYQIRNVFEVKIRVLEKAGDMLSGVVAAGANEVGNLEFSIDNEEALREEARRLAIADAKKKAAVLAKQLGVRLGRIVSFSESGLFVPVFLKTEAFGGGGAAISSPPVQAGENEIRANVSITYELR